MGLDTIELGESKALISAEFNDCSQGGAGMAAPGTEFAKAQTPSQMFRGGKLPATQGNAVKMGITLS